MPVSVDQAGYCEGPGSVDHDGPRMLEAQHVFPAADLHNRAIACSYSLDPGIRGIAGPDAARQDDQAGRPFGPQVQGPAGWLCPCRSFDHRLSLGAIALDCELTAARRSACPIDGRPPLAQANTCPQKHNSGESPLDRSCHVATSRRNESKDAPAGPKGNTVELAITPLAEGTSGSLSPRGRGLG